MTESLLKKRTDQMKDANTLPEWEKLYYVIGRDLGFVNDDMINMLPKIQEQKKLIKNDCKSIAEFNREFELTEAYKLMKGFKYTKEGLEKMMAAIRVMIESLKAESKGQY